MMSIVLCMSFHFGSSAPCNNNTVNWNINDDENVEKEDYIR